MKHHIRPIEVIAARRQKSARAKQADREFDLQAGRNIERIVSLLDAAKQARWALEMMVERYGPDGAGMCLEALNNLDRSIKRADT